MSDDPTNGNPPAPPVCVQEGRVEDLLAMCGFADAEIDALMAAKLHPWNLSTAMVSRLAQRVGAIEMYIARKVQDERKDGLIVPGGPGWRN